MDKITQALRKILPAEHIAEVASAVEAVIAERFAQMESEFQEKLEDAYERLTEEKKADEAIAVEGYRQAYEIVAHLMNRLDEQRVEFETALEEGFEEAYGELQKTKAANGNIEVELYEEFDKKLKEMKDIMVDKIDQFMTLQEQEIYEAAKKDVLSDPRISEQRVAVERMAEILSDYMSEDTLSGVSSTKFEEATRQAEALRAQLRIVEARNVKLAAKNNTLQEQVNEAHQVITEATKVERKERVNRRGNASGRGQRVVNEQLISEYASPTNHSANDRRHLTEGNDPLNDLLVLSGLAETR
jgi:hypothetical protein